MNEGSRTGRFEIAEVPIKQIRRLPCEHWCLICKDIQRDMVIDPPSYDIGDPCDICPDCSCTPEWTI